MILKKSIIKKEKKKIIYLLKVKRLSTLFSATIIESIAIKIIPQYDSK